MTSLILRTTMGLLLSLLLVFAAFLLLRGHDEPGGGFIAGLVAGAAFVLYALAVDAAAARRALSVDPILLMGAGLFIALVSGLVAVAAGEPLMTGLWVKIPLAALGTVKLGTPLLFDLGVFLVVVGMVTSIAFALSEEAES